MLFQNEVLAFISHLKASPSVQKDLQRYYERLEIENAERKSYENTYRIIYHLEHGQNFLQQGVHSPLTIKPVLLFYGMVQMIKANLMIVRPDYPENASVLAHGVSTRKRKKQAYSFLQDEVKIQQKGLFPYMAKHLFNIEHFQTDKFSMDRLLRRIPELNKTYQFRSNKAKSIHFKVASQNDCSISINHELLNNYHMTENRFINFISDYLVHVNNIQTNSNGLTIQFEKPIDPFENHPFSYDLNESAFFLSSNRDLITPFPELLVHYLVLYNLSMICRYETEWWGELNHSFSSEDFSFIEQFLLTSEKKITTIIGNTIYKILK